MSLPASQTNLTRAHEDVAFEWFASTKWSIEMPKAPPLPRPPKPQEAVYFRIGMTAMTAVEDMLRAFGFARCQLQLASRKYTSEVQVLRHRQSDMEIREWFPPAGINTALIRCNFSSCDFKASLFVAAYITSFENPPLGTLANGHSVSTYVDPKVAFHSFWGRLLEGFLFGDLG